MNKLRISFLIFCILFFPYKIYAFEFGKDQSAIKSEPIEIEDIDAYLDLNIFKYKLCLTKGSKISVTFKNVAQNQLIFSHQIDVEDDKVYTMRIMFTKAEGFPGDALSKDGKVINYSLNWNSRRVFGGSICNPLFGLGSIYWIQEFTEFGKAFNDRASLIKFFTNAKESNEAELVAEIFLDFDSNK